MVGEKLGSFRIDDTLGVGAMGVVYKATHEATGKSAAVKVVNKDIAQRGKTYERFEREALILKQFRHPNIVRWYAHGRFQGTWYLAMEFIPGRTLEQLLTDKGALEWREVVDLGIQICDALHYAHQHGVIHRDLKPSNLMVTEDGLVKLTDFGIAKDLDKTALTATGRTLGTAAYMAPEQIRDTTLISHKTDLYALGVVFYQMLTGNPPFDASSAVALMHAHLSQAVPRPSSKLAEIPKALDNLVVQMMAKSPNDRPWDAAAVTEILTKIRDKASKGENVAMVWPSENAEPVAVAKTGETTKKKKTIRSKTGGLVNAENQPPRSRFLIETGGLVLALLVIVGIVAYALWPAGEKSLYKQAERLMASKDRHDWHQARDEFLDPLDQRFPGNPYKSQTKVWRDKILIADVEGRARMLQSEANTKLNQPNDDNEQKFVEYFRLVTAAQKQFDDPAAIKHWDELAQFFSPDESSQRPWHLLAKLRADELNQTVRKRRELVMKLLAKADVEEAAGRLTAAAGIRADVVDHYGKYADLSDLLGGAATPGASPAPAPVGVTEDAKPPSQPND